MRKDTSRKNQKGRKAARQTLESKRVIPSDLQAAMTQEEVEQVMSLSAIHYVEWLMQRYETELGRHAEHLSQKFSWLDEKYGYIVNAWELLHDVNEKFKDNAEKFVRYPRPLAAMKRTMYYMVCNEARNLRNRHGFEVQLAATDIERIRDTVADYGLRVDERLKAKEEHRRLLSVVAEIPKKYWRGFQYLVLHVIHGMKIVEIARYMGVNHSNISKPMTEACKFLRQRATLA